MYQSNENLLDQNDIDSNSAVSTEIRSKSFKRIIFRNIGIKLNYSHF